MAIAAPVTRPDPEPRSFMYNFLAVLCRCFPIRTMLFIHRFLLFSMFSFNMQFTMGLVMHKNFGVVADPAMYVQTIVSCHVVKES